MHQPMRPFITAYKNRPSKSRMPRPPEIDDSPRAIATPLRIDLSADAPAMSRLDAHSSAARAAADGIFGKKAVEEATLQAQPSVPARRILPCLLQREAEPASPPEQTKKARRAPSAVKPLERKTAKAAEEAAIFVPLEPAVAKKVVEPPPVVETPDLSNVTASRRERSAIQNRWVRKTELGPGEKWKQRLCKAAR